MRPEAGCCSNTGWAVWVRCRSGKVSCGLRPGGVACSAETSNCGHACLPIVVDSVHEQCMDDRVLVNWQCNTTALPRWSPFAPLAHCVALPVCTKGTVRSADQHAHYTLRSADGHGRAWPTTSLHPVSPQTTAADRPQIRIQLNTFEVGHAYNLHHAGMPHSPR